MVGFQGHGIFYNSDENYALGQRCKERNMFQIDMSTQALTIDITIKKTLKLQVKDNNTKNQEDVEPKFPPKNP